MPATIRSIREADFTPAGAVHPSPRDWRDQIIYFLMVDRFDDNQPGTPAYNPNTARHDRKESQGNRFQGGNLKGVTRRLDYIRELGCTAIWLSPFIKNRVEDPYSYHGYAAQNFLEVDPRFGTMEDLRELVRQAHARGMYVIQDIVLNHTGDNWAYQYDPAPCYQRTPREFGQWREKDPALGFQEDDAVWPIELQNPDYYKRRGPIDNFFDGEQVRDGDFFSLKELDLNRPGVLSALIGAYKYWISQVDIDGFRVDTVKHMEDQNVALFCNAIREYAQHIGKDYFFMFGEVVGNDDEIQRYIGRNTRIEGTTERFPSLDACLDFPLYFVLEKTIKGFVPPGELRDRYEAFRTHYTDHGDAGRYFVTFVDNHDQMITRQRFMHGNSYPQQAVLAIGYLLTSLGVPCIYYGTEQGFDGGAGTDHHIRECMFGGQWGAFGTTGQHFFNPDHEIYRGIQAIARVRADEPALRYGRQYFREISKEGANFDYPNEAPCVLAWSRILDTDEILVAQNLCLSPRQVDVTVDRNLTPAGSRLVNLLDSSQIQQVTGSADHAFVPLSLKGHQMGIYKRI